MPRLTFLLTALALAAGTGCAPEPSTPETYVARVGDAVLTEADLTVALSAAPAGLDSTTAREQVIEQWVTAELMARDAEERGLRDRPDVQRQLAENERAVLAAVLLNTLYEEDRGGTSRAELEAYFERHRDRLRLREPYVRVRLLSTTTADSAAAARRAMQQAMLGADQDSLWEVTARAYASDTSRALGLGRSYVPESRFMAAPESSVWQLLPQLGPGQISSVEEIDDRYFVLQLVDRVPPGTEPELAWVEDEVRRLVELQNRKQMVARHVQRLRNEAQARDELDIRSSGTRPSEPLDGALPDAAPNGDASP